MMRCLRSGNTDGPQLGRLLLNAATVLRTRNCAQNGRSLLIGGRGSAGGAVIPSFLGQHGNWGMMIMTALYIVGLSIGGVIRVVRVRKHTTCEGIKTQSRDHAQNGEKECVENREMNRPNGVVFSLLHSRIPARLEISLSPANGVVPAEGPETAPERPVAASAGVESSEPRSAASVDLSGQIEAFAVQFGTPLDAWQLWVLRAAVDTSIRQRAAQRGLRPFAQASGV